jgi:hypothetical protein
MWVLSIDHVLFQAQIANALPNFSGKGLTNVITREFRLVDDHALDILPGQIDCGR